MKLAAPGRVGRAVVVGSIAAGIGSFPLATQGQDAPDDADRPVVVATKAFGESFLLGELFAQLLEDRGFDVRRYPGLGSTELIFQALRSGAVDVYPEYTGTGLLAILGVPPVGDARQVFQVVSSEFRARWGVRWLPPLGFENTFAIALNRQRATDLGLATISDLAREGDGLVGGFSPDFIGREDGLVGLREAYGLELADVRSLLQPIKYDALASGGVDVIDAYSTDGRLSDEALFVLQDDLGFFPPYEAAALVGADLQARAPGAVSVLSELSGLLTEELVRAWNRRIEIEGEPVPQVARDGLSSVGLVGSSGDGTQPGSGRPGLSGEGGGTEESFLEHLWSRRGVTGNQTLRHLMLVAVSLLAAAVVAVPLGLVLERVSGGAEAVIRGAGVIQTLPSIALLAFMIPFLGVGALPAIVALFLYSIFPILRNTFTGVRDADRSAADAALALGMTEGQVLRYVRLPLAAPVIMAGIRTAAVINVGTATLAAFIGAGGLGDPIVSGLALSDTRLILSGAIPAALLAVAVDAGLGWVERWCAPGRLGVSARAVSEAPATGSDASDGRTGGVAVVLLLAASTLAACGSDATGPGGGASGQRPTFETDLTDLARVTLIVPPGAISGNEIKPHSFIETDGGSVPIYAPTEMTLVEGTWVGESDDYGLDFRINARFRLRLGHITAPRQDIVDLIPKNDPSSQTDPIGPIPFVEGELIGFTSGTAQTHRFDFGLFDLAEDADSPNATTYRRLQIWTKLNGVCPYDYYSAELRPAYASRFGTIGGTPVPSAPCRTLADQALSGTVSGEWYLTSHAPDGIHEARFALGTHLSGTVVRAGGIGGVLDLDGAVDPKTAIDEVCYESADGRYLFLKLSSVTTLEARMEEGACPDALPQEGARSYER